MPGVSRATNRKALAWRPADDQVHRHVGCLAELVGAELPHVSGYDCDTGMVRLVGAHRVRAGFYGGGQFVPVGRLEPCRESSRACEQVNDSNGLAHLPTPGRRNELITCM